MGLVALPLGVRGVQDAWRLCVFSSTDNRDVLLLEGRGEEVSSYTRCGADRRTALTQTQAIPCAPGSVLCAYLFVKIDGLYVAQAIAALPMPQGKGPTRQHFNLVHPPEKRGLPAALTARSIFELVVGEAGNVSSNMGSSPQWNEVKASISLPGCTWTQEDLHTIVYRAKVALPHPNEGYFDRNGPLHSGEGTGIAIDWVGSCPLPYWATDVADPNAPFLEPDILAAVCACLEQTVVPATDQAAIMSSGDPEHRHMCLAYFQLVVQVLVQLLPYHNDAYAPGQNQADAASYGAASGPDQMTSPLAAGAGDCEDRAALIVKWCRHLFLSRARGANVAGESNLFRRARVTVMKEAVVEDISLAVLRNARLSGAQSHTVCLLPLVSDGYLLLDGVYPMGHQDRQETTLVRELAGKGLFFERASGAASAFAQETSLYQLVGANRLRFIRHGSDRASSAYGSTLASLAGGVLQGTAKYTHTIINEGENLTRAPDAWRLKPNPGFYGPGARFNVLHTSPGHDPQRAKYVTRSLYVPTTRDAASFDAFVREMEAKMSAAGKDKKQLVTMKIVRFDVPGIVPPYLVLISQKSP